MERNRWETAIRCLEIAVHPGTSDDEAIAAVNGFRRTAEGTPLTRICVEFACGGVPLADLSQLKDMLDRLNRENLELRRKLAVEEAAQANVAGRLDAACRRIYELTEEASSAQRLAETAAQEFAEFRAAYARVVDGVRHDNFDLRWALDETGQTIDERPAPETHQPFSAFLTEARLAADKAASFVSGGTGSGKLPTPEPQAPPTA
jgi:hypothetical protein